MQVEHEDSIRLLLKSIEGKVDLTNAELVHVNKDLSTVKQRQHDTNNQLQVLISLNLPEKLQEISTRMTRHDDKISKLELFENNRKATENYLKLVWSAVGAAVLAVLIGIFKFIIGDAR